MRNLIISILLLTLLGCQSTSYYAAQNTNQKRFGGWEKDDADYLVKTHDLTLRAEALSAAAKERANLRKIYVLALDTEDKIESIKLKYKLEASIQRVKLASALSDKSDEYIQKLDKVSEENFDVIFIQYYKNTLTDIIENAAEYEKEGHSERLKEFSKTLKETFNPLIDRANTSDLS